MTMEYECGSFKRNSSVAPFSLFISFFFLFSIFFLFFCGLFGSFYLSLICPLWDLFMCPLWDLLFCPLWDLFLTEGQHSIFYKNIEDRTLYKKYST